MSITEPSTALIGALMQSYDNWGARMAAKDQQLQQQAVLTQEAQQEATVEQQAQAQIEAFRQKLRSEPFEAPDRYRIARFLSNEDKALAKRLEEQYQGNRTKFFEVEGAQWMQTSLNKLMQSQEHQDAEHNREQLAYAKEAMKKNEMLVGEFGDAGGKLAYSPATQALKDYYAGKHNRYEFKGSYKPDDDVVKHFGSQYSPNASPWEETTVEPEKVLAHLMETNSREVALDKWKNLYEGKPVFYKRDSLLEREKFKMSVEDQAMQRENNQRARSDQQMQQAMFGVNYKNAQLRGQLLNKKLSENDAESAFNFGRKFFGTGNAKDFTVSAETGKKLPVSGLDLSALINTKNGTVATLMEQNAYGGVAAVMQKLGLGKANEKGYGQGSIKEGFTANGLSAIDLRNGGFSVTGVDNKIYYKPVNGQMLAFAKVTAAFTDDEDAAAAGLVENWSLFDSTTKTGTGVYRRSSMKGVHGVAEFYTPIGNMTSDPIFLHQLQKGVMGQKEANEGVNTAIGLGEDDYN